MLLFPKRGPTVALYVPFFGVIWAGFTVWSLGMIGLFLTEPDELHQLTEPKTAVAAGVLLTLMIGMWLLTLSEVRRVRLDGERVHLESVFRRATLARDRVRVEASEEERGEGYALVWWLADDRSRVELGEHTGMFDRGRLLGERVAARLRN